MFGCIVSGKLVQTEPFPIDENKFAFTIDDADKINHLVVFLLGSVPFSEGLGGAVYFGWPSADGPVWQYLGFISNNKPSAIFKVSKTKPSQSDTSHPFGSVYGSIASESVMDAAGNSFGAYMYDATSVQAQVGISIEPLDAILQQTSAIPDDPSQNIAGMAGFVNAMLQSLYNYTMSFASAYMPRQDETYIPASVIQQWYNQFERKLQYNPNFWKS